MIPRRLPLLAFALLLLAGWAAAAAAADDAADDDDDDEPRSVVTGRLLWVSAADLDLLGEFRADLPWRLDPLGAPGEAYVALGGVTTIERAPSDFTFDVRDLDYALELGWRAATGPRRVSFAAGQIGRERADADGQPWIRWIGGGIESAGFRRGPLRSGVAWRVQGGLVTDEREVRGDGVLRASLHVAREIGGGPFGLGFDVDVDALVDAGHLRPDVELGPRVSLPFGAGRRAALIVHWFEGRHPLGPRLDGVLVGVEVAEGSAAGGGATPPDLWGSLAVGGGEGRESGRFRIALESPAVVGRWRAGFEVDLNLLTADDTGDLFYRYHAGLQRDLGRRSRVGAWFYHRSNHVLAEPNDRVTSINVLEAGVETRGYEGAPDDRCTADGARLGCLDARARLGWLADSDFGRRREWHARAGVRWTLCRMWLALEAEAGDVERRAAAVGTPLAAGWELAVERRHDDQSFSRDRRAWLLEARYAF